ncbi:hypothetical protein Tco_1405437 [Tanacetum coccineum]
MQEVILFYNGLDVPTRQILDKKGAIPSKTTADAKIAIQEMVEYTQKWHNGTSRTRSTETSDGLAAIQAQLNNLGREIKKVNEKLRRDQVDDLIPTIEEGEKTIHMGLWYPKDSGFELTTFLDADHAGCLDTRISTSRGIQFLGDKLVGWMSKKQDCIVMSTAEAEYVALSVENHIIELYFVRTKYQLADMFTKALSKERSEYLVGRLSMRCLNPVELEVLTNETT